MLLSLKLSTFSPQKSNESEGIVLSIDSVSLKTYFKLLLTVKPANDTKFSIAREIVVIFVWGHGSIKFSFIVYLHVGAGEML